MKKEWTEAIKKKLNKGNLAQRKVSAFVNVKQINRYGLSLTEADFNKKN